MKKFITIALAVAVLFSFAACQPNGSYDVVQSAELGYTAVGKTVYLEGEAFDPEGYSFVLVNNVGGTTPVDAADLTFSEISADGNVTVTYLGSETIKLTLTVTVDDIESITVEIPEGAEAYQSAQTGADYSGEITVTGYNADKTLSRVLGSNEYTAKYNATNLGKTTLTVKTTKIMDSSSQPLAPATAPEITVVEDAVERIELVPAKDYYYIGDPYARLSDLFTVTATYASGKEDKNYTDVVSAANAFTGTFDTTAKTFEVRVKDHESVFDTETITPSDYYVDSTITVELANKEYKAIKGQTIPNSAIKVMGKLKSAGDEGTAIQLDSSQYELSKEAFVSNYETKDNVSVTVTVKWNGKTYQVATPVSVPVQQPEK